MNSTFSPRPITPPVVRGLLIVSIAFYIIVLGLAEFFKVDSFQYLGLYTWSSSLFRPWQLITHLFLHDTTQVFHLFFNMLGLWMFGSAMEQFWGSKRFLIYFLITGIGAGMLHITVTGWQLAPVQQATDVFLTFPSYTLFEQYVSNYLPGSYDNEYINNFLKAWYYDRLNPGYIAESQKIVEEISTFRLNTVAVGSSGAIYGLLLAFGMTFPNAMIMMLIPPIPMKAKYFVFVFGAIELVLGLRNSLTDNVAHFAHLGGMVFGIVMILIWRKHDRSSNRIEL
jgi:membrane associated rhomboid family serine protease